MTTYRIAILAAAAALLAVPVRAQTAGELLQKGIYTQDTAGDLDGAIAIYRQIVNSGNSPRDVAAQAQYRLAQSLLQKGDLASGATEFSNLARNYADYAKLIGNLAAEANRRLTALPAGGRGGRGNTVFLPSFDPAEIEKLKAVIDRLKAAGGFNGDGRSGQWPDEVRAELERLKMDIEARQRELKNVTPEQQAAIQVDKAKLAEIQSQFQAAQQLAAITFDSNSPVTVKGAVFKFQLMNPNSLISVDPMDGTGKRYTFLLGSASQTSKQGLTRNAARLGDEVTVTGDLATGGQMMPDGTIAATAATITNANGEKIYDRGQVTQ